VSATDPLAVPEPVDPVAPGPWRRATGTRKNWAVRATRPFGHVLFHSLFRMRVVGTEHVPLSGAVLLAGNHTGFLDGPLVYAFSPRPATFLAKSELFVGPLARALGWLGQVPVHRGRADRTALRTGLAVLAEGGALGVFPEGTRGAGQLEEVSDGLAYLALKSGAPVVPIAVLGTAEAMPKGARLPRWRARVTLVFGAPVTLSARGDPRVRRNVRAAAEELRLVLLAHLETHQHTFGSATGGASRVAAPEEHIE
jgi:1-acyl-sn-glycerol-3-phosphate acyltransferase